MKKIFFALLLKFQFYLAEASAFASDEIKTEDDSKPSITIQFNNMEKLEEKFEKLEKDVEGRQGGNKLRRRWRTRRTCRSGYIFRTFDCRYLYRMHLFSGS
jgi:hypothetical protein